ncbi:MAG: lytic transglycosylase domain-containing protein [Candidatus Aenigmatarchaeota archaeon]
MTKTTIALLTTFTISLGATWECFVSAGRYYGVDPYLLYSIALVESGLNLRAMNVNRNGTVDRGVMQINSSWDSYLKRHGVDLRLVWDACYNVHLGAMVLKHCMNMYGSSWKAVDCYNKGSRAKENSAYVWKVYRTWLSLVQR